MAPCWASCDDVWQSTFLTIMHHAILAMQLTRPVSLLSHGCKYVARTPAVTVTELQLLMPATLLIIIRVTLHRAEPSLHCCNPELEPMPNKSICDKPLRTYLQGKVLRALWTIHWRRLAKAAGLCMLQNLCSWSGPFLLQQLLSHLQTDAMIRKYGVSPMHPLQLASTPFCKTSAAICHHACLAAVALPEILGMPTSLFGSLCRLFADSLPTFCRLFAHSLAILLLQSASMP